eukprot:14363061-Heterocapsa_arctica.AAC.1
MARRVVVVRIPVKMANSMRNEALAMLLLPMIPLHRLRCFAGRGSWICQLLPRARWTISRLWAAVAEEEAAASK